MSDVQFTEESSQLRVGNAAGPSGLTQFVVKAGLAKDEKQASMLLVIAVVALLALAGAVLAFGSSNGPDVSSEEMRAALPTPGRGR